MRSRKLILPFQVAGARFLAERRFAILADDPGLGKTAQVLAALREIDTQALVIAPSMVQRTSWLAEMAWMGNKADLTQQGLFPSRGAVRLTTQTEVLRRKLSPRAVPQRSSVLVIDEPYKLPLAPGGRFHTKLARLCGAFVRADGAIWILCVPDLIEPEQLYRLLGVTGFMLRRRKVELTARQRRSKK